MDVVSQIYHFVVDPFGETQTRCSSSKRLSADC
jgi:hypothetical protein